MRAALILAGTLLVVAACSRAKDPGPFCPAGAIINGLDQIEGYTPGPKSTDTLRYSVSLTNIDGKCTYKGNKLTLSYTIDVTAQRGPAMQSPDVSVPYFVTVVDETGKVISKDLFTSSFTLTANAPTMRHRDSFDQSIDDINAETGRFYSVYFGFQNDPEEALLRRNL